VLLVAAAPAAGGQTCSQPRNLRFYEDDGYVVRKIELRHPLGSVFFVRGRIRKLKEALPLAEGKPFTRKDYDASFRLLDAAVKAHDSFGGSLLSAKVSAVIAGLENCQEGDGAPKTVDAVYRILSTDPLPPARLVTPEGEDTKPPYKVRPLLGYEDARRGYGGVDLLFRLPGRMFEDAHLNAWASPNSRLVEFELDGSRAPKLPALESATYHLAYHYSRLPASGLRLARGSLQARFNGVSRPLGSAASDKVLVRYGAAVEVGNQQSDLAAGAPPPGTITDSGYAAVRAYAGLTKTNRYSEAALSYGLQAGGRGVSDLSFVRHVGDATYTRRFPGGTHAPWDVQLRFSAGAIKGSSGILLNDRFFGGNSVVAFVPGEAWFIPAGPIVRSIASQRLNGEGFGGTSFYSANATVGKVVFFKPLVPPEVEEADGFAAGVEAAENTAQRFFEDDYLAQTPTFQALAPAYAAKFKSDLDGVQGALKAVRAAGTVPPALEQVLKDGEGLARRAQNDVRHLTDLNSRGMMDALKLRALINPSKSRLLQLIAVFPRLRPFVTPAAGARLTASEALLRQHMSELQGALDAVRSTPDGLEAAEHARRDMLRPREIIDTLRHEVNIFSFSPVAIFDAGRVWPDRHGVRYAVGGGARFSLLGVNFTAGYAFNPHPRPELGQGRGAMVFALTYTNLFR
jgi:hypothetical protein